MTEARWTQDKTLFEAAVELPTSARAAFLAAAAGGDEQLRREVESLLRSDDSGVALTGIFQPRDVNLSSVRDATGRNTPPGDTLTQTASAARASIGPYR